MFDTYFRKHFSMYIGFEKKGQYPFTSLYPDPFTSLYPNNPLLASILTNVELYLLQLLEPPHS